MADLRELYQEVIFDHYKRPRNFHALRGADCSAEGHNPLCGDRVTVYLKTNDGVIEDVSFEGSGCAISTASASLMTEVLKGKSWPRRSSSSLPASMRMVTDASAVAAPGPR